MSSPPVSQQTVVVTHLYKSDPATTATSPPTVPQNAYTQKFLEGEPKALGVTQILIGLVHITIAIPLVLTIRSAAMSLGTPFLIGVVFIISGAVSIAAEKNPHIKLLRACLATNIISSMLAAGGAIVYIVDIAMVPSCASQSIHCENLRPLYPMILLDTSMTEE
uniref:membrane-spanning 4-domains subfamily A member 15-like isoform X2 n=1 Tax=Pristiophorus japonicus TaxID=55135 RepID=UPI00398F362B